MWVKDIGSVYLKAVAVILGSEFWQSGAPRAIGRFRHRKRVLRTFEMEFHLGGVRHNEMENDCSILLQYRASGRRGRKRDRRSRLRRFGSHLRADMTKPSGAAENQNEERR